MTNSNSDLQTILDKLTKISFNDAGDHSVSNAEWSVSIRTNFLGGTHEPNGRVQLELWAKYKGAMAVRWGSENAEQNDMIAEWYVRTEASALRTEMHQQTYNENVADLMFKSL